MTVVPLLNKINEIILNPIIFLLFAVALLIFFFGVFQFINSETTDAKRTAGKQKIMWGLVGMFIMISAYGIIGIILGTFGIRGSGADYLGI